MFVADFNHGAQNIIPGLLIVHDGVGEHASIPTNMPERFGQHALFVAQPVTSIMNDIEFTIGV
jgi:hypothetical protein